MRFAGAIAILISLSAPALGAVDNTSSAPSSAVPAQLPRAPLKVSPEIEAKIDDFCGRAHLSISAMNDCMAQMAVARTDQDRIRVEHTFALGGAEVAEPQ
jgi:hypothetical protein